MNEMRREDIRSERRIANNKIRRQHELKKNILLFTLTLCLAITCLSVSGFRSNAKNHSGKLSPKYYKSIIVSKDDTLWSIAKEYMDQEYYDSINDYIMEVRNMNSLSDDDIYYGEYLIIPYYNHLDLTQAVE